MHMQHHPKFQTKKELPSKPKKAIDRSSSIAVERYDLIHSALDRLCR